MSTLGIMATQGPNAGSPLTAQAPFYGTSQWASNSSMAHGYAQQVRGQEASSRPARWWRAGAPASLEDARVLLSPPPPNTTTTTYQHAT